MSEYRAAPQSRKRTTYLPVPTATRESSRCHASQGMIRQIYRNSSNKWDPGEPNGSIGLDNNNQKRNTKTLKENEKLEGEEAFQSTWKFAKTRKSYKSDSSAIT